MVFNKAADSCDYPRNVVCPKTKTSQATASTTRAPIVAATSRTTYLYSTTRRPTTQKPVSAEEYEYYDEDEHDDDDDDAEVEEEATESKEKKKEPKVAATPKTLLYKTITRNKPTTTTTTTTEAQSTTSRSERNEPVKLLDIEDEEDPRVIKELINLIKKAGDSFRCVYVYFQVERAFTHDRCSLREMFNRWHRAPGETIAASR